MGGINRNGVIAIVLVCAVVLCLALGLGLGFGLDSGSSSDTSPPAAECYSTLQYSDQMYYDDTIPWNRVCPTPNVPDCPAGVTPPLILISLDGFRAEYLTRNVTPTIARLSECGVHAPYIRSTYPTKTFPNHYTIVTGLYPESHGIVANKMYDIDLNEEFRIGSDNSLKAHWWLGEPIWNTVMKAGRRAVTMYWPGSEAPIQDMRPSHCYNYNEDIPFEDRVNEIMGYFSTSPDLYPSLVTFYLHEPDLTGHSVGPYGSGIAGNLTRVDHIIQLLMSGLQQKNLDRCANVMVVSDHGMDNIDCDRTVDLLPYYGDVYEDLYVYDGDQVRITSKYVENDGVYEERPNGASAEEILDRVTCSDYNTTKDWYVRFDKKQDLPIRLHYSNNVRIDEVVGEIEAQWLAFKDADSEPWYECTGGSHGYDAAQESMHAIFVGSGPGFKSGYTNDLAFDSIELYNLMTDLLELTVPAPNNGTSGALHDLLSTSVPLADPVPPLGSYNNCLYPGDSTEEGTRRNSTASCNWVDIKNFTTTPLSGIDGQLNLDAAAQNESISNHLPLGVPQLDFTGADVCQLTQKDYITGYSHAHHMPLWTAFKLTKNPSCDLPEKTCYRSDNAVPELIRPDVRLSSTQQTECNMYTNSSIDVRPHFLFPPSLIDTTVNPDQVFDGHISTNIVPMYEGFRTGVWQQVLFLLEEYASKFEEINVVVGPVFDFNSDGLHGDPLNTGMLINGLIPLPTHYYVQVWRCPTPGTPALACADQTLLLSMVLLHKPKPTNCWDRRYFDYIEKNVVRVRDIELLTGLRLHASVSEQRRLHMAVHMTETLWPPLGWMDLTGADTETCPSVGAPANCPIGYDDANPPLLLISIDGFRPDYVDRGLTPTLKKLRDCGTATDYMRSIYPTLTFPNHYTITSGLYPESHGIVDNNMYDMTLSESFYLGSPSSMHPEWWNGEPLWNNVLKNNKTAVTLFWPGSDVEIGGMRPTDYYPYNGDMPYTVRVSTVLDWLEFGADGKMPDFITLYFSNVDHIGHEAGPDSLMISEALSGMDGHIQDLMDGIYRLGLHECINVIIVSDHGMTDISCDWNVILNDYIDMPALAEKTYLYYGSASRMSNKYWRDDSYNYYHVAPEDQVPKESIINNLTCDSSNMNVFDKVDLPKRHHFANNDRIDDITFISAESWLVEPFSPWCAILGQHGWDPHFETMKAYFSAYGPGFKDKFVADSFENIELYNLMNHLLGISPSANNGTQGSLNHLLKNPPTLDMSPTFSYTDCSYPDTDAVYDTRANLTTSMCTCTPPANSTVKVLDNNLNFTSSGSAAKELEHLPHGRPYLLNDSLELYVLHNDKFVSGYDHNKKSVSWTAFTLTGAQVPAVTQPDCLRPDVRLEQLEQASCADYQMAAPDMTNGFLFPPAWSGDEVGQMDSLILTNTVPMYSTFWTGIWQRLLNKLSMWATNNIVHIVVGPIYDYDANGRADHEFNNLINDNIPVPSHFYAIALRCPAGDCVSTMNYEALSFVLPHKMNITNCVTENSYLLDNSARIRDIELLTDIQFLTANITLESIRTRTFIPTTLWDI